MTIKKLLYLLFLCWGLSNFLLAQEKSNLDSLEGLLLKAKKDTHYINLLQEIASIYKDKNEEKSLSYAKEADSLSSILGYANGKVRALASMGWSYYRLGKYDLAFSTSLKALKLAEKEKQYETVCTIHNNIGASFYSQNNYDLAIEHFTKAYEIASRYQYKRLEVRSLNNIAFNMYNKNDLKNAEEVANKALKLSLEYKETNFIMFAYRNLGDIAKGKNALNKALQYYQKCAKMAKEVGNNATYITASMRIARAFIEAKKTPECIALLENIEPLAYQNGYKEELMNIYLLLSQENKKIYRFEKALNYYEKYNALQDSIFNTTNTERFLLLEKQFDTEKKQAQIELLNKEQKLQEHQLKVQKMVMYGLGGGLILVIGIAIFAYRNYQQKRDMNEILIEQKQELVEKNEEILVQKEEMLVQSEELRIVNNALLSAYHDIEKKNRNTTASIYYAQGIQKAILPPTYRIETILRKEDYFILYKPKDIVSGDFYWLSERNAEGKVVFIVADCTGHGVPGALMSMIGNELLSRIVNMNQIYEPSDILGELTKQVKQVLHQEESNNKDGMDLVVLMWNETEKIAYYSGAMNSLYYIQPEKSKELQEIKASKFPIGGSLISHKELHYQTHAIQIDTPTYFYLCTDGYPDQFGGKKDTKFMYKNFKKLLQENHHLPLDQQRNLLDTTFEEWRSFRKQTDDVAIWGIRLV